MEGIWKLFEWIAKLAYINILWIIFSLLGFVFLGIGPATVGVFAVIRKLINDESVSSIWKLFVYNYRQSFWTANKFMLIILSTCFIMYLDFLFLRMLPNSFFINNVVFTSMIVLTLLLIVLFSYLFAVYVHFDLSFFKYFKYAVLIAGINPLPTIFMLFGLFVFLITLSIIPAISVFYLPSIPVLIIQFCAKQAFKKLSNDHISK